MNTKLTPLFDQDLSLAQFYERVLECAMTSTFSFSLQNSLLSISFQKFYELLLLEDYLKAFKNTKKKEADSLTKTIKKLKKKVEFFLKNIDIACIEFSKHFQENGYVFKKKSELNQEEKEKCMEYIKNEIIPILEFTSEKYVSLPHDRLVIFGKNLNKKEEYMFSSLPKTENIFKIEEKKFVFLGDIISFLFDELSQSYGSLKELSWFIPVKTDCIEVEEFVKDQNCIVDFMIRKNPQKKILAILVPEHIPQETTKKISKILNVEHHHIFKMTDIFFRKKSINSNTLLIPNKDKSHATSSSFFEKKIKNSSILEQIFEKDVFFADSF